MPQLGPELVIYAVRIARDPLGQFQRSLLSRVEIGAVAELLEIIDLLFRPTLPPCQGGMGGESILTMVELRRANDHQLLQLGGQGPAVHDCAEMRNHGAKDFRTVRDRAEHVWDITAFLEIRIVDFPGFGVDLLSLKSRDTGQHVHHSKLFVKRAVRQSDPAISETK